MNCAAIPESLMESELFGYEEGAFTGARKGGKIGKIQLAHKGTFSWMRSARCRYISRQKLLRVLSERKIDRIGSNSNSLIDVDVRIIAATNRNLEEMIREEGIPGRPVLPTERGSASSAAFKERAGRYSCSCPVFPRKI